MERLLALEIEWIGFGGESVSSQRRDAVVPQPFGNWKTAIQAATFSVSKRAQALPDFGRSVVIGLLPAGTNQIALSRSYERIHLTRPVRPGQLSGQPCSLL